MFIKKSVLAVLAMASTVFATESTAPPNSDELPALPAKLITSFPNSDVTLGLKLVNQQPTLARIELSNLSEEPLNLAFIGGRLVDPERPEEIIKNYTLSKTVRMVEAGKSETVDYEFVQDILPREVLLNLFAAVQDQTGQVFQVVAFNGTASVVDAPFSVLDPQILFLYLVIAGVLVGTGRFIYTTWIQSLLPAPTPKPRAEKPKKTIPAVVEPTSGDESAAASGYDESWIPDMHKKPAVAKRVKGGRKKTVE